MNKIFIYIFPLLIVACNANELPPRQYVDFINNPDNGYFQSAANGNVKVECLYKPVDYIAVNSLKKDKISKSEIDSVAKEIGKNSFYELKLYTTKPNESTEMYISYFLEKDLYVLSGNDTTKPNSYIVEPTGNVLPYQKILFSIPAELNNKDLTVVIDSTSDNSLIKAHFLYSTKNLKEARLKTK